MSIGYLSSTDAWDSVPIKRMSIQRITRDIIRWGIIIQQGHINQGPVIQIRRGFHIVYLNLWLAENTPRFRPSLRAGGGGSGSVEVPEHNWLEINTSGWPAVRNRNNAVLLFRVGWVNIDNGWAPCYRGGLNRVIPRVGGIEDVRIRNGAIDFGLHCDRVDNHGPVQPRTWRKLEKKNPNQSWSRNSLLSNITHCESGSGPTALNEGRILQIIEDCKWLSTINSLKREVGDLPAASAN